MRPIASLYPTASRRTPTHQPLIGLLVRCSTLIFFVGTISHASLIFVDTAVDEFASSATNDAGCSLREAVHAANTNAPFGSCASGQSGEDIIFLPFELDGQVAVYELTIAPGMPTAVPYRRRPATSWDRPPTRGWRPWQRSWVYPSTAFRPVARRSTRATPIRPRPLRHVSAGRPGGPSPSVRRRWRSGL